MYARLPESAGLAAGATAAEQEQRLLRYYSDLAAQSLALPDPPRFSLLLDDTGPAEQVEQTIRSVALQLWPHWEFVWAPSPGSRVTPGLLRSLPTDKVREAPPAATSAAALQSAFEQTTGDYVIPLSVGDRLYPSALAELVRAIDLERNLSGQRPAALYSDERTIDAAGWPVGDPVFKPAWSPILLRNGDYIGGLAVYDKAVLSDVGGPQLGAQGRYDVARAVAALHSFGHVPAVLVQRRQTAQMRAAPPPPSPAGSASIIIPTRDAPALLAACVDSVLERTSHPDFDVVLVDNGSTDPAALQLLTRLARDERVQVVAAPGPFNFAALCNRGIRQSNGDTVVLLNNDTEVLTDSWLTTLCSWAAEPGVGAVGPQLRYPDGRIQHAGLAGMATGGTGHLFVARDPAAESPLGLARCPREVLAVTGACLAVRREAYWDVGGLDERHIPNDSGDIDLCLRLRRSGRVSVYAPDAVLIHHESPSRGRSFVNFERQYLLRKWPQELLSDPYLNPNLARSTRYEPDPRFDIPDVPPPLFERWLRSGSLG